MIGAGLAMGNGGMGSVDGKRETELMKEMLKILFFFLYLWALEDIIIIIRVAYKMLFYVF